jgi:hypothetical protein
LVVTGFMGLAICVFIETAAADHGRSKFHGADRVVPLVVTWRCILGALSRHHRRGQHREEHLATGHGGQRRGREHHLQCAVIPRWGMMGAARRR